MGSIEEIEAKARRAPASLTFREAHRSASHYFGTPRSTSGSHVVFRTPWAGDPRINIQNLRGGAKAYQVRQIVKAIDRLTEER